MVGWILRDQPGVGEAAMPDLGGLRGPGCSPLSSVSLVFLTCF
jgi:hypothetical protein